MRRYSVCLQPVIIIPVWHVFKGYVWILSKQMRYHGFCYFRCFMLNVILVDIAKDLIQDIQDDCTNLRRWHKTHLEYVHSGEQLLTVGNYGFNNFFQESMWYCPTLFKQWDSGLYLEIGFYFKHCRTKTFPVLICDNSYCTVWFLTAGGWSKTGRGSAQALSMPQSHSLWRRLQHLCFGLTWESSSKGGKKQLPYTLLGLKDSFHVIVTQCLMFPKIHYDIVSLRLAITACTPCLLQMADKISWGTKVNNISDTWKVKKS